VRENLGAEAAAIASCLFAEFFLDGCGAWIATRADHDPKP